jgi:hypothetical protein
MMALMIAVVPACLGIFGMFHFILPFSPWSPVSGPTPPFQAPRPSGEAASSSDGQIERVSVLFDHLARPPGLLGFFLR